MFFESDLFCLHYPYVYKLQYYTLLSVVVSLTYVSGYLIYALYVFDFAPKGLFSWNK